MRIHFERSGGFVGRHLVAQVDTGALSVEEARVFSELLRAADFFRLPPVITKSITSTGPVVHAFEYRVTVELEPSESGAPAASSLRHTVRIPNQKRGGAADTLAPSRLPDQTGAACLQTARRDTGWPVRISFDGLTPPDRYWLLASSDELECHGRWGKS
jgi:Emfourin